MTCRAATGLVSCEARSQRPMRAFQFLVRHWRRFIENRRSIMERRRVSDEYIASWFAYDPVAFPAPKPMKVRSTATARTRTAR